MDIRVEQIISQLSDDSESRHIFIQHLLSETRDRIRIRSELLNNLMAGRDTIASMLTNAWFELSKHPEAWAQLQEEVGKFSDAIPTYAQLQNMPYLRAIFNESMRLYPQLPENGRVALEDTVLPLGGGLDGKSPAFVPKGRVLMWGTYALHRRADIFGEDALSFNPDRWLDTPMGKAIKPGWGFLAFGGGARVCIGRTSYFHSSSYFKSAISKTPWNFGSSLDSRLIGAQEQFALLQASYVSTRLAQTFSTIESRDSDPWIEQLALVCNNLGGCKVSLS